MKSTRSTERPGSWRCSGPGGSRRSGSGRSGPQPARSPWAGGAVEDADAVSAVFDAVPEDVDDAPVPDLAVEALEELAAGVVVPVQVEGTGGLRLGVMEEGREVGQVHGVGGEIVLVVPGGASRTPGGG